MWNRLSRYRPFASYALAATACLTIAGCGDDKYDSSATAELQEQISVLRRAASDSERNPPAGLAGLREARRVGPRNVRGTSLWIYVNEKGDRVCPWLETRPEKTLQTSCLTPEQVQNASISSSGKAGTEETASYGLARDGAKCMLLTMKNGDVTKASITQNGWLVRTTSSNPVTDAKPTTASCT